MLPCPQIRKIAIKTLSDSQFALTPKEKLTLARSYRIADWLTESLTAIAQDLPVKSLDELEASVGLRTAYRIVGIQVKVLSVRCNSLTEIANDAVTLLHGVYTIPAGRLLCCDCTSILRVRSLGIQSPPVSGAGFCNCGQAFSKAIAEAQCPTQQLTERGRYQVENGLKCGTCKGSLVFTCEKCSQLGTGVIAKRRASFYFTSDREVQDQMAQTLVKETFRDELEEIHAHEREAGTVWT